MLQHSTRVQTADGGRRGAAAPFIRQPAAPKTVGKPAASAQPKDGAKGGFLGGLMETAKKAAKKKESERQSEGFFGELMHEAKRKAAEKTTRETVRQIGTETETGPKSTAPKGTGTGKQKPKEKKPTGTETPAPPAAETHAPDVPTFESLFTEMLERYAPETVAFTPIDEDALRETIVEWLRPAYEQAIARRREQTEYQNAELDADALARGMGASTYVTDVKERALRGEARDVGDLENDYASTLAQHLYDALKSQQEKQIEVERFNAEQRMRAREHASDTALKLYQTYLRAAQEAEETEQPTGKGGGSGGSGKSTAQKVRKDVKKVAEAFLKEAKKRGKGGAGVDLKTATELIARMSPQKRSALYAGTGAYARHRQEILDGIGSDAFAELMRQYPAS